MTDKIKVFVRLRPRIVDGAHDVSNGYEEVLKYSDHRVCPLQGKEAERGKDGYVFQRVFSPTCKNEEVFDEVKEVTSAALDGISGTIFAYGQTATGKTHTMRGGPNDAGVTERVVSQLFDEVTKRTDWTYTVEVAYFEIHNEKVYDLIAGTGKELDLRVDSVQGLQFDKVTSASQAKASLDCGEAHRKKSKTDLNEHSSRSHTVFKVQITGVSGGKRRKSQLHLVDLAGSENAKAAGYADDSTQREGGAINKSLLALTSVIKGLADKNSHINYRDSKITRILQNSLGGNARTYIICCITSARKYFAETMSTIHFANRARVVYNAVKVNEVDGTKTVPWESYNKIVNMYREDLDVAAAREQMLRKRIPSECAAVLMHAQDEMARNEELYQELDYQTQQALHSATTKHDKYVKTSQAEAKKLNKELEVLRMEKKELVAKVEASEGAAKGEEEKLQEIEELKEMISKKEKEVAKKEKEISDAGKDKKRLASEMENLEKSNGNLEEKLEKAAKKLKTSEEKCKELSAELKEKGQSLQNLEAKNSDMEAEVAKAQDGKNKGDELQEKNDKMKTAVSEGLAEVKAIIKEVKAKDKTVFKCSPLKDLSNELTKNVDEMKKVSLLSQLVKEQQLWPSTARHVSPSPAPAAKSPSANKKSQAPKKRRTSPSRSPLRTATPMSKLSSLISPQKPPPKKTRAKRKVA